MSATNFYRNLGLAGGSLWLISVGTFFAGWSLLAVRSSLATTLAVFLATAAAALIVFGVLLLRSVRRLPHGHATDGGEARRKMARQFGLIVAAEGVGCSLVAAACLRAHNWELIVPLCLVIVGLHFLPLARLFRVPRYNVTASSVLPDSDGDPASGPSLGAYRPLSDLDCDPGYRLRPGVISDGSGGTGRGAALFEPLRSVIHLEFRSTLRLISDREIHDAFRFIAPRTARRYPCLTILNQRQTAKTSSPAWN